MGGRKSQGNREARSVGGRGTYSEEDDAVLVSIGRLVEENAARRHIKEKELSGGRGVSTSMVRPCRM